VKTNLLTELLIQTDRGMLSLPGLLAAMARGEVAAFPALRPHQRPAWHMFLVQLAVLALSDAGATELPEDEEAPYDKAHRLWEEGDIEAALTVLTEMNRNDPEDLKVLIDLAQLKAELGDLETAEQVLDSLPAEEKMQQQAKQLAARIKFLKASAELPPILELEDALDKDPKDPNALHLLALHQILKENNADAMELLIRLMQLDSKYKDEVAKTTLIELFDKLGNNNPNVRAYRRKLYTLMH
jgi:putative thioredoxin